MPVTGTGTQVGTGSSHPKSKMKSTGEAAGGPGQVANLSYHRGKSVGSKARI